MIRVFVSPHGDDEALSEAAAIATAVESGDEVHVVLASNGSTSAALAEINGQISDGPYWGTDVPHNPAVEGYEPLTPWDMAVARTAEFRSSCGALGVRPENVHLGRPGDMLEDLPDAVSAAWAMEIFTSWADHFAGQVVAWATMWWYDGSPDHAHLGQAGHKAKVDDPDRFSNFTFFIKASERTTQHALDLGVFVFPVPAAIAAKVKARQRHAAYCYCAWNPARGSYAVGKHSVGTLFDAVIAGGPNYCITRLS
jgi:LmbE family N-acetylglucosaminyl deacetylase